MSAREHSPGRAWSSLAATFGKRRARIGEEASGILPGAPDPVAAFFPEDPSEVAIVLQTAKSEGMPVVASGAGSRMAGGSLPGFPQGPWILLGMKKVVGVEEIDADSLWLSALAGTSMKTAAKKAAEHGLRLAGAECLDGTVGGWLSVCSRIPDPILGIEQPPVLGLEAVLATGNLIHSVNAPRAATGPDLFSVFLGTRGGFGIITKATLKLEPVPEKRIVTGFHLGSVGKAGELLRALACDFFPPRDAAVLVDNSSGKRKARIVVVYEGDQDIAEGCQKFLVQKAAESNAKAVDPDQAREWATPAWPGDRPIREGGVVWSRLAATMRSLDAKLGDVGLVVIDRPGLNGCRLRVQVSGEETDDAWRSLVDPDSSVVSGIEGARAIMERIRRRLDPQGLINPHAWPLPWVGGSF